MRNPNPHTHADYERMINAVKADRRQEAEAIALELLDDPRPLSFARCTIVGMIAASYDAERVLLWNGALRQSDSQPKPAE